MKPIAHLGLALPDRKPTAKPKSKGRATPYMRDPVIEYNGHALTASQWAERAEEFGHPPVPAATLSARFFHGWTPKRTLTTPYTSQSQRRGPWRRAVTAQRPG
jgi:hypothetical protein